MKTKSLYFCVLAFVLCFTTVTAQLGCRMYSVVLRPGQRVCQRMCYPRVGRPNIACYTARRVERQNLCHPTCCRFNNRCQQLLYT
ncbi:uncharacterized protein LOC119606262 isoform X1 [Lucilia sericata]|uniref:uncharacterized protein LOC119606262 isoform X1 n=1 Tax=Lucilia sericata TaxID=13632 RepID=UPI0018A865E9|nr:uncharacterized protein LOC119606262 isoform X1 [Lucilia sericata]